MFVPLFLGLSYPTNFVQAQDRLVPESQEEIRLSFAPLVKRVAPAVVNVYATRLIQESRSSPFFNDPFFRRFFNDNQFGRSRRREDRSLGSGVIVSADGIVVTNHHVIQNANEVKLVLADKREYEAEIVLKDERTDLAILQIIDAENEEFTFVNFADSDSLDVGDIVLAIGNPFGVGQTVTQGIVSALARTQVGVTDYQFFIQTDAAINPGNSGGALIDMGGNLVGINTAIYTRSGGSNGIGFAIPVPMVQQVVDSASGGTSVKRPWLGAKFQTVSSDIAESMGLERPTGVLIVRVEDDSPAHRAGMQIGDLILKVAGREVASPEEFEYRFATRRLGGTVEVAIQRDEFDLTLEVPLESAPESIPRDIRNLEQRSPLRGAQVANLSPAVAEELRISTNLDGVVVVNVQSRSPAARIGLKVGDIIRQVNNVEVDMTETLVDVLNQEIRSWDIQVERNGQQLRINYRG